MSVSAGEGGEPAEVLGRRLRLEGDCRKVQASPDRLGDGLYFDGGQGASGSGDRAPEGSLGNAIDLSDGGRVRR